MAFYGRDFIFNGTMSQELGLTISSESSEASTNAGSDVEPIIQKIYRRPKNYLLGVEQGPVLTFPISFNLGSDLAFLIALNAISKFSGLRLSGDVKKSNASPASVGCAPTA